MTIFKMVSLIVRHIEFLKFDILSFACDYCRISRQRTKFCENWTIYASELWPKTTSYNMASVRHFE